MNKRSGMIGAEFPLLLLWPPLLAVLPPSMVDVVVSEGRASKPLRTPLQGAAAAREAQGLGPKSSDTISVTGTSARGWEVIHTTWENQHGVRVSGMRTKKMHVVKNLVDRLISFYNLQ